MRAFDYALMPTVLVVDVSLSLAHALQGELLESYKEFIQEGIYLFIYFLSLISHCQISFFKFIQSINIGLLYLLKDLETNHPLELISFITFSSNGKVVVPFTRNFTALKNALYVISYSSLITLVILINFKYFRFNIKLEDKTIVTAGMKTAISHIINTFGTTTPVQIILVTNGCKLGGMCHILAND